MTDKYYINEKTGTVTTGFIKEPDENTKQVRREEADKFVAEHDKSLASQEAAIKNSMRK